MSKNPTEWQEKAPSYFARLLKDKGIKVTKRKNELIISHGGKMDYFKVMNLGFDVKETKIIPPYVKPAHVLFELISKHITEHKSGQVNFSIEGDNRSTKISFHPIIRTKDVLELKHIGSSLLLAHSGDEKQAMQGLNLISPQDAVMELDASGLKKTLGLTLDLSRFHISQKVRRAAFDLHGSLLLECAALHPDCLIRKSVLSNSFRNILETARDDSHEHSELAKRIVDEVKDAAAYSSFLDRDSKVCNVLKANGVVETLGAHKKVMGDYERSSRLH